MSKRPYIINQAFVLAGGKVVSSGPLKILVDYSTYDGMVEDVSVQLFTNESGMAMINEVLGELWEDYDESAESTSGNFRFEDGHAIQWNENNSFGEIRARLQEAYEYAKEGTRLIDLHIHGELARKTWYSIETRDLS